MGGLLEGQAALVTGASRGIGRAIAICLAGAGAQVIVNYREQEDEARKTVSLIEAQGGAGAIMGFDVSDLRAVEAAISQTVRDLGKIDILVNNAGVSHDALLMRVREEQWQASIDVNLKGVLNCARVAARSMIKARYGRIINISSVSAQLGTQGQAAYAAAKAGVLGLTRCIAREFGSRGITANAVSPGYIETEMTQGIPQERKSAYLGLIPLGRLGTPEDVAETVLFLVGPGAGYITGQVVNVNGGLYM